ncbi:MAG: DUF4124 domain-containing protein [Burkholderiaceae bacterium]|nr:DUF4124 domain-containing protein [Burkholderiaceae bacterium]
MNRQLLTLLALMGAIGSAYADGEIYKCVNANGTVEFKNTGPVKDCKKLQLEGISVIPAPPKHNVGSGMQTTALKSTSSTSPSDFPRVDSGTQKARDNDRRQILLDEMKSEQDKLAALKKDYNDGQPERQGNEANYLKYQERVTAMRDDIARTEKNIEALQRELKRESGETH